jgi:hypothetical protein
MNNIQSAEQLLEELREAYRRLPPNMKEHVKGLLRQGTREEQPDPCLS